MKTLSIEYCGYNRSRLPPLSSVKCPRMMNSYIYELRQSGNWQSLKLPSQLREKASVAQPQGGGQPGRAAALYPIVGKLQIRGPNPLRGSQPSRSHFHIHSHQYPPYAPTCYTRMLQHGFLEELRSGFRSDYDGRSGSIEGARVDFGQRLSWLLLLTSLPSLGQ